MKDFPFEVVGISIMTSTPFIVVASILCALTLIMAWPTIIGFFQEHFAPYRSGIPGMLKAALLTDFILLMSILIVSWVFWKLLN